MALVTFNKKSRKKKAGSSSIGFCRRYKDAYRKVYLLHVNLSVRRTRSTE